MTELRDLLDAYAGESGAINPDDGTMREQCARRAFTALRHVLDAMDLVTELMPNGTPAVPVSVLRGMITRALTDDGVADPQEVLDSEAPIPPIDRDRPVADPQPFGGIPFYTPPDPPTTPWAGEHGPEPVEPVHLPLTLASVTDTPVGTPMPWPYPPGPELITPAYPRVVRAACPCYDWAVPDARHAAFPAGHHAMCDGTGHRRDQR